MYTLIKRNKILKVLGIVNEMGEKFPLLKLNEINFFELAKFYKLDAKDLKSMVVFLDALKEANRNSNHSYYVDINEIERIKVNRKDGEWTFHVYRNKEEKVIIRHNFSI